MLTERQLKWLEKYKECRNATEAAVCAFDCKDRKTASVMGAKMLKHPKIKKILDKTEESLHDKFREEAEHAFMVLLDILNNPKVSPKTRLEACKDVLDRAGYNPTQKQELIGHVTFEAKAIETAKRARLIASSTYPLLQEGIQEEVLQGEWESNSSSELKNA